MNKNLLGIIEQHVEKVILGLAVVFLGAIVWMYGIQSPNKVQFGSQTVGPRELNDAIDASAKELERRIRNASAKSEPPPRYSEDLKRAFSQGIFAKAPVLPAGDEAGLDGAAKPAAPPVPVRDSLRVTTVGGSPIAIPGEGDKKDAATNIALVTPLKPLEVKAGTGRSLVVRKQPRLGEAAAQPGASPTDAAKSDEPVELAWVTIAGYFDKKAQEAATSEAKYDPANRRAYVAGVDVERREMLASGEWSEWELVENSRAMPEFKIAKPIPNADGTLANRKEVYEAWTTVKREQASIMQPKFYEVKAGDAWKFPHESSDEEEPDATVRPSPRRPAPPPPPPVVRRPAGEGPGRGGAFRGGVGGEGIMGGRSVPGGGGGGGGGASDARQREEARKRAKDDLDAARKASREKDYSAAMTSAQQVLGNEHANASQKSEAQRILDDAQKKTAGPVGVAGVGARSEMGGGLVGDGGMMAGRFGEVSARGMGMQVPTAAQATTMPLVEHPEKPGVPAIWFHDDTVEAGKTYQYRMRVRMWNRYVNQPKSLARAEDAAKATLEGEWSSPTDPITVAPATHFFVRGMKPDSSAALVEVWKWRRGHWVKQNFEVNVGDVVGGIRKMDPVEGELAAGDEKDGGRARKVDVNFETGAIVLDLRIAKKFPRRIAGSKGAFQWTEGESLVMTYLDPADGQVKERSQAMDANDPIRKMLQSKEGGGA